MCFQLEQSCKNITLIDGQKESICRDIDLLHVQLHESNTRVGELEKHNIALKNDIEKYKVATVESQM